MDYAKPLETFDGFKAIVGYLMRLRITEAEGFKVFAVDDVGEADIGDFDWKSERIGAVSGPGAAQIDRSQFGMAVQDGKIVVGGIAGEDEGIAVNSIMSWVRHIGSALRLAPRQS